MESTRLRSPAEALLHRNSETALCGRVGLGVNGASHLVFALLTVAARDHAVHQDAGITSEVYGLRRAPRHDEPQVSIHDKGLDRTDSAGAVPADRPDQHDARAEQPTAPKFSQPRLTAFDLRPAHWSLLRYKAGCYLHTSSG